MTNSLVSRRDALRVAAVLSTTALVSGPEVSAATTGPASSPTHKTLALSLADLAAIDAAMGKKGACNEAQATHVIALPRNDLKVKIKGEPVPISFSFGGWMAIKHTLDGQSAMLTSDTVLLQEEVNLLISNAFANGLEIGAIHNHFFYEEPRIFYTHVMGMGAPAELARQLAATLKDSELLPANQPAAAAPAAPRAGNNVTPAAGLPSGKELFDLAALDTVVKHKDAVNGLTYKYTVGRDDLQSLMMNTEMTAAIGLNSWAAFAGKQDDAHIAGDMAMLEHEVNPVIKALRAHNLDVMAVHNDMLGDTPRMVFLHYYGRGPATQLATGFRAALDQLGKGQPKRMGGMKGMK